MLPKKREFAHEIETILHDLCQVVFNMKDSEQRHNLFGISDEQVSDIIAKLAAALPDTLFESTSKKKLEELKTICARELIFFQVQERNCDAQYPVNLENFLRSLVRDLKQRF